MVGTDYWIMVGKDGSAQVIRKPRATGRAASNSDPGQGLAGRRVVGVMASEESLIN